MAHTMDSIPALVGMKYDDHDMLASTEITKGPYVPMVVAGGSPILLIPQDSVRDFEREILLGLICVLII